MNPKVLITGSSGLIGGAVARAFLRAGWQPLGLDLIPGRMSSVPTELGDVRDATLVQRLVEDVVGVVHLAAVSRVAWGERDSWRCHSVNVDGTKRVLVAAAQSPQKPWIVHASSREVFGDARRLPVSDDAPLRPKTSYGRSKQQAEKLVADAVQLRSVVLRLTNTYGHPHDHAERVIPSFIRAARAGRALRVEGPSRRFDFTHVDDVARGILIAALRLHRGGGSAAPVSLVSGQGTSLSALAALIIQLTSSSSSVLRASTPAKHVHHFIGDPSGARHVLGWTPQISLRCGFQQLVDAKPRHLPARASRPGTST